jgi:hypothetical protein
MRAVDVLAAFSFLLLLSSAACGGGNSKPSVPTGNYDDGGVDGECIDDDGDGFGRNCSAGRDCDDTDPQVTDECRRCTGVAKDCPCKPGTKTMSCTPPVMHVAGGTLVCKEGNRYCRDGYWSDCETIGQYIFVADPE